MAHFEKLPLELRNMIYTYAMVSNYVVYAKDEDHQVIWFGKPLPLPLLEVSKNVSKEALPIFYAVNMFQISPESALGKASVFTKHATLLRSVRLEFCDPFLKGVPPIGSLWTRDDLVDIWKKQIRALFPMLRLRTLWLDVSRFVLLFSEGIQEDIQGVQRIIIDDFIPELLASLPPRFRKNAGSRGGAIWISAEPHHSPWEHELGAVLKAWRNSATDVFTVNDGRPKMRSGHFSFY